MNLNLNDGKICPQIGFGTYKTLDVAHVVSKALDVGYRMLDCAAVYHNEHLIGQSIDDAIKDRKVTRDQLFIISKVWPTSLSRGLPLKSALKSVKDLKCDYLDLLLIHWPLVFAPGEEDFPLDSDGRIRSVDRPLEDIWTEFQEIERSGLVKSIGVSNFNSKQLNRLLLISGSKPQVNQIESHPFLPNQVLVDYCLQNNVRPMAYCPLARGRCLQSEVIQSIAKKRDVTGGQVALKWLLTRGLAVIPMTSRVERLRENFELGFELNEEEVSAITALNCGQRISLLDKHKCNELKEWPFNESQQ